MKVFRLALAFVSLVCLSESLRGEERSAPEVLAPFVDEQTVLILRLDLARADVAATAAWLDASLGNAGLEARDVDFARASMKQAAAVAEQFVASMKKAQARELYMLYSLADFPDSTPTFVVPLQKGADARTIGNLLSTGTAEGGHGPAASGSRTAQTVGNVVVCRTPPPTSQPARAADQPTPEMKAALTAMAAAAPAALTMILAPSADMNKAFAATLPQLPGNISTEVLARGIQRATLSVRTPPEAPWVEMRLQAPDEASAGAVADQIRRALAVLRDSHAARDADALATLEPIIAGNSVSVRVDRAAIERVILPAVLRSMTEAAHQSMGVQSMRNARDIVARAYSYAQKHGGAFPPDLRTIKEMEENGAHLPSQMFINPLQPERKEGYVFLRPPDGVTDQHVLVLYEAFDEWPGDVAVGYADGHVERVADEAEFRKQLEAAKAKR